MDRILAISCFLLAGGVLIFTFPEGIAAVLVAGVLTFAGILLIRTQPEQDQVFLTRVFLLAVLARILFGLLVHVFDLRDFFGGDAETYHRLAQKMTEVWFDGAQGDDIYTNRDLIRLNGIGWGMSYLLAIIYSVVGRNILAAQFFYAIVGAATAPLIYSCSFKIFNNRRVSMVASMLVAISPSFIIWTGQLLKDGIIIFLLVLAMTMVLRLQKKFDYLSVAILVFSLFGIISFRFYIFYMIAVAVFGTFLIGQATNSNSIFRRIVIITILGLSLTYLGVVRYAGTEFERYGNLESVQRSRQDASGRSQSGFGGELDITTTEGALSAIPVGFIYLMLAPFPWQVTNLRQAITIPDILLWWLSIPFLISGLIYSVRNKLRGTLGILIFSIMLSLAYSLFQGNVGTAYRQRTQIQVFLFIFVGVGYTIFLEKRENTKIRTRERRKAFEDNLREKSKMKNDLDD